MRRARSGGRLIFAATIGAVIVLAGCGSSRCASVQCGPCPPALSGSVVDASTGEVITSAVLIGDARCGLSLGQLTCLAADSDDAPVFRFALRAPGYRDGQFKESVAGLAPNPESCCNCPHLSRVASFGLDPER